MTFTQFIPFLTLIASLLGAWITIRITIAELKKDITHLQEKLELITTTRNEHEKQSKDDMKETIKTKVIHPLLYMVYCQLYPYIYSILIVIILMFLILLA